MRIERAFELIHLTGIPETKRKFWPQWSTVVVSKEGAIDDVIQHFEEPNASLHRRHMDLYPRSVQFTAKAGETYATLASLEKKVSECLWVHRNY